MSLETTLTDIIARLRQGRFPNEQAISRGIMLRVLQELGWHPRCETCFVFGFRLICGNHIRASPRRRAGWQQD